MKLNCAEFYSKEPMEEMIFDLIYRGKHRISGGNTHWCEHAPLHWSVPGTSKKTGRGNLI